MKHIGLFEGIGGFSVAAHELGWKTSAWCEWNEFGKKVLRSLFPNAEEFSDITKTDFTKYANKIDIITGGFPCQPYSVAGKRLGDQDERHLWPEMLRAIREVKPRWVVAENVRGLVNWSDGLVFEEVQTDLENEGYEVQSFILPACGVNAPHRRDRVWIIAYSFSNGLQQRGPGQDRCETKQSPCSENKWQWIWSNHRGTSKPRIATNSFCNGLEYSIKRGEQGEIHGKQKEEGIESGSKRFNSTQTNSTRRIVTDSESRRPGELRNQISEEGPRLSNELPRERNRIHGNKQSTTNSNGKRLWGQSNGTRKSRQLDQTSETDQWSNFPTQPPIRIGDDGFQTQSLRQRIREDCMGNISEEEIDTIISKALAQWRNETIKAAGNAIVPQVAIQIFQAIIDFEQNNK